MVTKTLFAALLAAIFVLACGQGNTDDSSTTPVEVVNTDPELEFATLAIEITGKPADALQPRRLGPPTESPLITLTNEENGQVVNVAWTGTLAYAKVKMGTYVCEVVAQGFAPDTSSITVNQSDLGSTVNVTISLRANGPTKPEPVDLGTYSVLWANWTPPDESTIGMFNDGGTVYVTYQPAFEDEPATYSLEGDMPELTCRVEADRKVNCPAWTAQDGTVVTATGEFGENDLEAKLMIDYHAYQGMENEYHEYRVFRLVRE